MSQGIIVRKEVFDWAIKESGLPINVIEKNKVLFNIIERVKYPTFKQLMEISRFLNVPFGMFFLERPPREDYFLMEFKEICNKVNGKLSKDLRDIILEMDYRKSWMSEFKQNNGFDKLDLVKGKKIYSVDEGVKVLKEVLKIDYDIIKDKNPKDVFKIVRERIESLGVLVMMNNFVGSNTHRVLDINEFRAFVLNDEYAPLIFLNSNDTYRGVILSLLHEFVYLLLDKNIDDILVSYDDFTYEDGFVNFIVKEFLNLIEIDYSLNKIESSKICNNTLNLMTKDFYISVIEQTESGNITFPDAFKLIGVNARGYDKVKKEVGM